MSPDQPVVIRKKKKRRRRRQRPIFPYVLAAAAALVIFFVARRIILKSSQDLRASLPAAYIVDEKVFREEYGTWYGQSLQPAADVARFRSAADSAAQRNFAASISILESLGKTSALPVVFHDIGVAYASLGDNARAADAFRDALAREPQYAPTRQFLARVESIPKGAAEPYTREQEPNNDILTANLIPRRAPVGGEIKAPDDSEDYYRFAAPRSPRDRIVIRLENHSIDFAPRVRLYDANLRILSWGDKSGGPGESLEIGGGPAPDSTVYISVSSDEGKGGLYVLSVTPQHAYDSLEPNDDILSARRMPVGADLQAGILDAADRDFFSFQSPRKGTVTVQVRNLSTTLIPALTMFNADRRNIGFAQDVRKPGADIKYTFQAEKDLIYYLQVSSQADTAGAYAVRVE